MSKRFVPPAWPGVKRRPHGHIVTFGIRGSEPRTSYGYIQRGEALGKDVHAVKAFVEKPDAVSAARYLEAGYLWNSGNFLFRADVLLGELARFEPDMLAAVEAAVEGATTDLGFLRLEPRRSRARRRNPSTMR